MVIEDKGCVFVKSSIIAIIDSVVYDLYYGKIVIRDNTSNQKKIISSDFHSRDLSNLFPMNDFTKYLVIYKATNQVASFG